MLSNGFKAGLTLVVSFACVASSLRAIAEQVLLPSIHERLGAGASVKIVCFGDSVTGVYYHSGGRRAYPEMLETALNKLFPAATVHVINAGVSGHSTADGIARLKGGVLKHRPDLVTVMFGLNDMVRVPLDQFRGNLRKITAQIRSSGLSGLK